MILVFCYGSGRENASFSRICKDERQLQQFVKIKHACVPIGRAIFNWLCFYTWTSPLLDAPFSTEYGDTSEITHTFIIIGCAILTWLYF